MRENGRAVRVQRDLDAERVPVEAPQIEIRPTEMVVHDIGVNCVELMPVAEFAGVVGPHRQTMALAL